MGKNLVQKIVAEHLVAGTPDPGEPVSLRIDQTLLQDATGTLACLQFEQLGLDRVQVPFAVQYIDHNILQIDFKNPDDHRFLQGLCGRYGIHYSRPGNGICHYLHIERFAKPGGTLIGADSHTTTSGALGMLAIGAGGLDVAVVMGGQPFEVEMPKVVGVELRGKLRPWVTAKDIILELLRRRGVAGGLGRVMEFRGDGVATLDVSQRATICNMCAELGATSGIFPSDERTREWLDQQQRPADFAPLAADADAAYDETEVIDLAQLEPLIAKPSSPGSVVPVREVEGTKAAQVCIGSSVNSGYGDLAIAAAVLRGKSVHASLVMTVTPGSRQILDTLATTGVYTDLVQAGARMLEPACGPCVGMGQAPPSGAVSVRTFNRNFPGRSGTTDDQVYLCSPTTAAATALFGVITDPRKLGDAEPAYPAPVFNPRADDGQIIAPLPADEARRIEIVRGPNIQPPPKQTPLPGALSGRVLTVRGDDISTGDLSPDGAEVMAFRSNIEKMASFVFRRLDPEFPQRAKAWGGGIIVGGANYGQGSSREHAAVAPRHLGVLVVIAKSFARIHRRNLVNFGILPLTFVDEADYAAIAQGDELKIADVRKSIEAGAATLTIENTTKKTTFEVTTGYSPRQREILLAGGLLNFVKALAARN